MSGNRQSIRSKSALSGRSGRTARVRLVNLVPRQSTTPNTITGRGGWTPARDAGILAHSRRTGVGGALVDAAQMRALAALQAHNRATGYKPRSYPTPNSSSGPMRLPNRAVSTVRMSRRAVRPIVNNTNFGVVNPSFTSVYDSFSLAKMSVSSTWAASMQNKNAILFASRVSPGNLAQLSNQNLNASVQAPSGSSQSYTGQIAPWAIAARSNGRWRIDSLRVTVSNELPYSAAGAIGLMFVSDPLYNPHTTSVASVFEQLQTTGGRTAIIKPGRVGSIVIPASGYHFSDNELSPQFTCPGALVCFLLSPVTSLNLQTSSLNQPREVPLMLGTCRLSGSFSFADPKSSVFSLTPGSSESNPYTEETVTSGAASTAPSAHVNIQNHPQYGGWYGVLAPVTVPPQDRANVTNSASTSQQTYNMRNPSPPETYGNQADSYSPILTSVTTLVEGSSWRLVTFDLLGRGDDSQLATLQLDGKSFGTMIGNYLASARSWFANLPVTVQTGLQTIFGNYVGNIMYNVVNFTFHNLFPAAASFIDYLASMPLNTPAFGNADYTWNKYGCPCQSGTVDTQGNSNQYYNGGIPRPGSPFYNYCVQNLQSTWDTSFGVPIFSKLASVGQLLGFQVTTNIALPAVASGTARTWTDLAPSGYTQAQIGFGQPNSLSTTAPVPKALTNLVVPPVAPVLASTNGPSLSLPSTFLEPKILYVVHGRGGDGSYHSYHAVPTSGTSTHKTWTLSAASDQFSDSPYGINLFTSMDSSGHKSHIADLLCSFPSLPPVTIVAGSVPSTLDFPDTQLASARTLLSPATILRSTGIPSGTNFRGLFSTSGTNFSYPSQPNWQNLTWPAVPDVGSFTFQIYQLYYFNFVSSLNIAPGANLY